MQSPTPHDSTPDPEPSANESPHHSREPLGPSAPGTPISPHHLPLITAQAGQSAHNDPADTQQLYKNNIHTEESLQGHDSNVSAHQGTPNESPSPTMSSKSQKARNKTLGFQPKDTLNDPPSFAARRPHQPQQQSVDSNRHGSQQPGALASETNFSRQTRAKSTGPGPLVSRPDAKRQRLDSQGTRQSRGISQPALDDYSVPSDVQHISSRSAKRTSRDSTDPIIDGSVASFRILENTMIPSRAIKTKQAASSTQKSSAQLPTTPDNDDDFEMSGMPKEPRERQQDDHGVQYAEKSVVVSRDGGLKIYLGSSDEPSKNKMDGNHPSVSKIVQRGSREPANSPELPPTTHHKAVEDEPMENPVSSDDTQEAIPTSRRAPTSSPRRRTVDRDDDVKSPSSDEDPDRTDPLQKDSDEAHSDLPVKNLNPVVVIPPAEQSPSAKHKPIAPEPGDGFNERMPLKVSKLPPIPTKAQRLEERDIKKRTGLSKAELETKTKTLVSYYNNQQDFTGPLKIHYKQETFAFTVIHGVDESSTINLKEVGRAFFSDKEDARSALLKGSRTNRVELVIYLVFETEEDMQWFRERIFRAQRGLGQVSLKITEKPEAWVQDAYDRRRGGSSKGHNANDDWQTASLRLTRSGANGRKTQRNGNTNDPQKSHRFRPYTEAVKKMGGLRWLRWESPLHYPLGANVKQVATVDKKDLDYLEPDEFLNDNLVWFGLKHVMENHPESKKRVHCFNTYFYNALTRDGKARDIDYDSVKRWTTKQGVHLFEKDYVIVPINHALHWYVAIICNLPSIDLRTHKESEPVPSLDDATVPRKSSTEIEVQSDPSTCQLIDEDDRDEQQKDVEKGVSQMTLSSGTASEDDMPEMKQPGPKAKSTSPRVDKSEHEIVSAVPKENPEIVSSAIESLAAEKSKPTGARIITLDSLDSSHPEVTKSLKQYLMAEAQDKLGAEIKPPPGITAKNIPFQPNFCDCGLYLIEYVKRFLDDPETFVDKVLNHRMNLDYWPNTVAEDLRDDFRELVLEEGCKQNGITPAQEPTDGCDPDDLTLENPVAQESAGTRSEEQKATNSAPVSPNVNGSEKTPAKSRIRLFSSNKMETPICDEPSSPGEQGLSRELRKEREDSTKPDDFREEVSRTETLLSRRSRFRRRPIYIDDPYEDERPSTRGKQI